MKRLRGVGPALLGCAGLAAITAGVYELAGEGWALVAGGIAGLALAIDWRAAE